MDTYIGSCDMNILTRNVIKTEKIANTDGYCFINLDSQYKNRESIYRTEKTAKN